MQQARAAMENGRTESALRELAGVLHENAADVDARHLYARGLASLGRLNEAITEFGRVLSVSPEFVPALIDGGVALTLTGRHGEAIAVLERALRLDSKRADVHFGLGLCRLQSGDLQGAKQAFEDCIVRNPRFADAFNNLGVVLDRLGRIPEAIENFQRATAIRAEFADAHRNLGDALYRSGQMHPAVAAFQRAVALRPRDALYHADLGAAQLAAGDFAAAAATLAQALALNPALADAAANLGEALRNLKMDDPAADAFRRALAIRPDLPEALAGLSKLAAARGDAAGAATHLRALRACRQGEFLPVLYVSEQLEERGCRTEAVQILQEAAAAEPGNPDLHDALGSLLHRAGHLPEALSSYESALSLDEGRAQTHLNRGRVLESLGAIGESIQSFQRAMALTPGDAECTAAIASAAMRICDWDTAESTIAQLKWLPGGIGHLHPFLMLACDLTPSEQASYVRQRATKFSATKPVCVAECFAHERMRVAYVSPDFRNHPVAHAIAGVIERHDRSRVMPVGISLTAPDASEIGARLRNAFEVHLDASGMSDQEIADRMRAMEIDVAVDLAGFTAGARSNVFALRAAPVQINYLGFPGSMGVEFIDYIVADEVVLPSSHEEFYSERVLRMPNSYLPFDCGRVNPDTGPTRTAAGLPESAFVFCAFNNGYKITRGVFAAWMALLREVPDSVLWLRSSSDELAAALRTAARGFGITDGRLLFAGYEESMDAHLARLRLADLFLDTLPYNAHTTAAEALWAGVPVLSHRGSSFAGRVGASVLTALQMPELISGSTEEYQTLALEFARSDSLRQSTRARLRQRRDSAPLFDTTRYTRDLENLLLSVWKRR